MSGLALSALDLATVADGTTSRDALKTTEQLARRCDELGFRRFWVAEHHNLAGVASTSPAVLIAHLAAVTTRIRVGSGGVMLPNHPPLVVAEQFALLEALHPGRIDLGIGRAPGTDPRTAAILRRSASEDAVDAFPQNLLQVMGLLGDQRSASGMWTRYAATPAATSTPTIVLLGSSTYSAQLAGMLGIPFAYAHHFETGYTEAAVDAYRSAFQPSAVLASPYLIITASALAAHDRSEAESLAAPSLLRRFGLRTGRRLPLLSPADAMEHEFYAQALAMPTNRIVGEGPEVAAGLADLGRRLGASEVMLAMPTHHVDERIRSFELIATQWDHSSLETAAGS